MINWVYRYMTEQLYRQWIGACVFCVRPSAHVCSRSRILLPIFLPQLSSCLSPAVLPVWISGLVQTLIYCDFFYYYLKSWKNNEKLTLPS